MGGLVYIGDERQALAGHGWNEVVIDGRWVPVDPTWNELPADAARIRLGDKLEHLGLLAALGKAKIEVIEVRRRKP